MWLMCSPCERLDGIIWKISELLFWSFNLRCQKQSHRGKHFISNFFLQHHYFYSSAKPLPLCSTIWYLISTRWVFCNKNFLLNTMMPRISLKLENKLVKAQTKAWGQTSNGNHMPQTVELPTNQITEWPWGAKSSLFLDHLPMLYWHKSQSSLAALFFSCSHPQLD